MTWREHPLLRNRFHPDFPDDLQVIVHDGGPRLSPTTPELMWARVTGQRDEVFSGFVLNEPHNLTTVKQGDSILFLVTRNCEHPFRVTAKYLAEKPSWEISPCDKCGFTDLFDAPSDLVNKLFPNAPKGASMDAFTSFCPICRGVQVITSKAAGDAQSPKPQWWRFWK
jgi:hypothetical protein